MMLVTIRCSLTNVIIVLLMIALIIPVNSIQHVQEGFHTLRHAGHGAVAKPKNYFFDFGSNDGSSITFFMGCDVFGCQGAQETLGGRKTSPLQGMGTRFPGRSWDIIAVEANLRHETALRKVKATIEEKTESKVTLFAGHALATHSGNITFYFDTAEGDAGATVMSESGSVWGHKFQHVVSALDIVSLFRSLNVHVQDRVVVKMDIEGAECDVMRYFIAQGLLPLIDTLAIEFHHNNVMVFGSDQKLKEKFRLKAEALEWLLAGTEIEIINWG